MTDTLNLLLVEDSPTDAKLVVQELQRTWRLLVFERVERKDAVQHNLERYALSPRECEVVMLVHYGYSNRRIADQLFLTEYTVEDHFKRIFAKLGVRSRTALAAKILGWHAG